MNKVLNSFIFYKNYIYYRLFNKYSKEIYILPWFSINFFKGNKGVWYVRIKNKKCKLENVYNATNTNQFMLKFGFSMLDNKSNSIFGKHVIPHSTYLKSDMIKMGLIQKLVDQRIEAAMNNTAAINR